MKLIPILALATAMTSMAAAQNAGSNAGQQSKPSPTPAGQQNATAKATPAKTGPGTAATKAGSATAKSSTSAAAPKDAKGAPAGTKGAVQAGVLPEKKTATHKNAPAVPATTTSAKTLPQSSQTAGSPKATTPGKVAVPEKAAAQGKTAAATPSASASKAPVTTASKAPVTTASKAPVTTASKAPVTTKTGASSKTAAPSTGASAKGNTTAKKIVPAPAPTTAKKSVKSAAPAPASKVTAKATGPSTAPEKKPAPRLIGSNGRRDPFISPIRNASAVSPTLNCTSGKRCLAIPELTLQGTVRDISGKMMAIVGTSTHRTYTLRENDQVFNGSVEKITTDSIIFREYVKDALGRESAKEVVKKMGPTS
jgi:hypothetical protein